MHKIWINELILIHIVSHIHTHINTQFRSHNHKPVISERSRNVVAASSSTGNFWPNWRLKVHTHTQTHIRVLTHKCHTSITFNYNMPMVVMRSINYLLPKYCFLHIVIFKSYWNMIGMSSIYIWCCCVFNIHMLWIEGCVCVCLCLLLCVKVK